MSQNIGQEYPRKAFIHGNFGKPILHPPSYDVSPDRTPNASNKKLPSIGDWNILFDKMMEAKQNENLDEYYRYRDALNELDRRGRHLSPVSRKKRNFPNAHEDLDDLEEIDCDETEEYCEDSSSERPNSSGLKKHHITNGIGDVDEEQMGSTVEQYERGAVPKKGDMVVSTQDKCVFLRLTLTIILDIIPQVLFCRKSLIQTFLTHPNFQIPTSRKRIRI